MTASEDSFYMERYCYVLASWFDIFDSTKHFSKVVPHLSLSHSLLRLSILAWAAKHYYLTKLTQSVDTSLAYYDRALRMLTTTVSDNSMSSSPAVFASCLLLAISELMGDSYQDWQLHLEGTYSLVMTHGWHGHSVGLGGACFWVYARMDVLSSLSTAECSRLPTELWLPTNDEAELYGLLSTPSTEDWSNQTVFLLAQIHNLLCKVRAEESADTFSSLLATWNALREKIQLHQQRQPYHFKPLAVLEASDTKDDSFPTKRYLNESISLATQFWDVAKLLFILARPERCRRERSDRYRIEAKTFITLARQTIATSVHNRHEANWVGATQLLSVTGMALTDWAERKALVKCFKDIHLRTGWNTHEMIDALLAWWGWSAPLNERGQSWTDVHEEIGPYASASEWMLRMFDCGVVMKAARMSGHP
ncbi:uncharacterized protein A1O9_11662 [Exophiala aquamarina CBS 119918]|uniref:Transcription factor domain-containing protein n=1 Tax=Exophiala aquamarina CBS 119918 TaxID=1182545 RepID=A0A072NXU1_9EURO|nr:uncharacterized protein A1O9_11662 [Exophiala aquamarina CBS 119918]KEF52421.1 hypothetical protein A1O9_11662 [Exophiala aquamarina CBS 119918]